MWYGSSDISVIPKDGKVFTKNIRRHKYIPSVNELREWITSIGFNIIHEWGDRDKNPISDTTCKATFVLEK